MSTNVHFYLISALFFVHFINILVEINGKTISHSKPYKILVAPLDWGLGHATRCIPIIYFLIEHRVSVSIASDGKSYELLKKEFANLPIFLLKGYDIRYSKRRTFFSLKILIQLHKILRAILSEHWWLRKMQRKHQWDLVISDNRYGLFSTATKTIIITHQLNVFSGWGKLTDIMLQRVLYSYINRFDHCWIPDAQGTPNLTGILGHPVNLPKRVAYIGPISRMNHISTASNNTILILLSGPEPQRSLLEKIILTQVSSIKRDFLLVRGLPSETALPDVPSHVHAINYLGGTDLSMAMNAVSLIICRSGYSSVMDLVKLQKKAILIPTPGQTEQEYLGKQLMKMKQFVCQLQDQIDIKSGIQQLEKTELQTIDLDFDHYKQALLEIGI